MNPYEISPMELVLLTDDLVWQMGLTSYLGQESLSITTTASTTELDVVVSQYVQKYIQDNNSKNRWSAASKRLGNKSKSNLGNNSRNWGQKQAANRDLANLNALANLNSEDLALHPLVLLLDLDWGSGNGWEALAYIRRHYSWLKILVLAATATAGNVHQLQGMGVMGCCLKSRITDELLVALGCFRAGEKYFSVYWQGGQSIVTASKAVALSPWRSWPTRWGVRSRQRLAQNITMVERQLAQLPEKGIIRAVLAGQRRELAAMQWLAERLLPGGGVGDRSSSGAKNNWSSDCADDYASDYSSNYSGSEYPTYEDVAQERSTANDPRFTDAIGDANFGGQKGIAVESWLFQQVLQKLNNPLRNLDVLPLEIDILQETKRRELLCFVTKDCGDQFKELRRHTDNIDDLKPKIFLLLTTIWRKAVTDLLGQYTVINQFTKQGQMALSYLPPGTSILEIVLADQELIEQEFLHKIPYVPDLLAHLFFEHQLCIDNAAYGVGSVEALRRAQILLENLIITIANAVIQPILNHLGNLEEIKNKLYDRRLMPTREVEHFRNELTWKYRRAKYFDEPQAIFESRYSVYALTEFGIRTVQIYAPRKVELQELEGIRFMVTLALELQDALTPRLKAIFSLVGSGLVYVLTNVVGRGLGLIGRGILQGIGSALQDKRFH